MVVAGNAVKPEHFARHLKTRDLLKPLGRADRGLEKAGAYRKQVVEPFAVMKQQIALFYLAPHVDQRVNLA